ncbi:cupin-like domain-containing protein [uncultured Paraglaciecola sp.]|uniref:cupin-like domain-containing protein n=1 Tax=uncultured Paraglaciecola sp. TaxID=1765024 RepID=UPI0025DEC09F|nr:cupin-like domain-containing protein [uncultured Paraglaciecola sp.]
MFERIEHIQEISEATNDSLTPELLCSSTPVVLRGLIKDWPLVKQATESNQAAQSYLRQHYNQNKIRAFAADAKHQGRFFYNDDLSGFNFTPTTTTFDKVLDELAEYEHLSEPPGLYMGSTSVDHILPGFRQHNDIPTLADKPLISMWIGNQSRIAAHYDVTDNIACVAAGTRRFTLFPPNQLDNLYIGPLDFTPAGQPASLVDFHQPDLVKYPKFAQAMEYAQVANLEAGDAIFIPSMWWHHVEGLSNFNILVNYWWRQVDNHLGAPMDALNHALLSIKDLPQAQRDVWRDIFEHYVFSPQQQTHIPDDKKGVLAPISQQIARKLRASLVNNLNR